MKRRFLCVLCFLLIGSLLLSGCGKKDISARMEGLTDPRGSIPFDQRVYREGFLETSFADYYTLCPRTSRCAFIQVQPKGSNTFVPLCSKPNCMHNDENCNAACLPGGGLGYCNNRLYTVADVKLDYTVVSMLPDGTDRKTEVKTPSPVLSDGTISASYRFVFHENWLLELYIPSSNIPLEEQVQRLFVIDLTTNSITEPFSDFFTPSAALDVAIRPVGKTIYAEAYFRNDDGTTESWWVAMNMDTGDVKKLLTFDYPGGFNVENDIFYYQQPGDCFMEYDLRTGETTNRGLPVPDAGGDIKLDGELIYTITNATPGNVETWDLTMYFLNRDYEVLDQIHLGSGIYPQYVDKEFCYFAGSDTVTLKYRLDKSAIGTGNLKLIPLE